MTARDKFQAHVDSCPQCDADPLGCCDAGMVLMRAAGAESDAARKVRIEAILSEPKETWK